jgi:FkbM family methyltransferase
MLGAAKSSLRWMLARAGYRLTKLPTASAPAMPQAVGPARPTIRSTHDLLSLLAARQLNLGALIDVGASDGRWTRGARQFFPGCRHLLIEAQPVHEPALREYCGQNPDTHYVLAAAGEAPGEINFHTASPLGGKASYTPFASHNLVVPITTVDAEVERLQLPGPYLLKLDTHGFEGPILNGARRILPAVAAIVVECYNFRITPECLLFHEMCARLADDGFRCLDLVNVLHRPRDGVLWQMDMAFIRPDPAIFDHHSYR